MVAKGRITNPLLMALEVLGFGENGSRQIGISPVLAKYLFGEGFDLAFIQAIQAGNNHRCSWLSALTKELAAN